MKTTLHTDNLGNLILQNGKPQMYRFAGGYYSYDEIDDYYSRNYYIADYQGNNHMVESYDNWLGIASEYSSQGNTDYYPYGNLHRGSGGYKYSGKFLDRTYGLDLYDFHARQYDPIVPMFTSIDPLAEKYYSGFLSLMLLSSLNC